MKLDYQNVQKSEIKMGNLYLAYDILLEKQNVMLSLPMRSFLKGSRIGYINAALRAARDKKISCSILILRRNDTLPRILNRALYLMLKCDQSSRMFSRI